MPWILLVAAGCLEVGWAVGLKYTEGFTRPLPSVLTAAAIVGSMALLAVAVRDIPIGTGYAVWVGIGTFGAVLLGILFFDEPATAARIFFLALLGVAVVGLRFTSGH
ncbi:MAG: multidrug efflux SMR transporter [Dehalococcoidia bacterium]|nr:multidrug efflux SMR transporter [Dehalococcoidia bacterium]